MYTKEVSQDDDSIFEARVRDHRYGNNDDNDLQFGLARSAMEKALRIIREPVTHRKYVIVLRENLDDSTPTDAEGKYLPLYTFPGGG